MIQEVSAELIRQFAANLHALIAAEASAEAPATPVPAANAPLPAPAPAGRPISGFALGLRVLWRMVLRLFGRRSPTA